MNEFKDILLWCVIFNYAVVFIWFLVLICAHDWMYAIHTRWFKLSREAFDLVHYSGMALYKIGILLFCLVPLIALHVVS